MIRSVMSKVHYIEYERTSRKRALRSKLYIYVFSKHIMKKSTVQQFKPIPTKRTLIEHEKDSTYSVENTDPGLEQTHKCGRVKPVNGIPNATIML